MSLVTISRQTCSLGDDVAALVSDWLGWTLINREIVISQWLQPLNERETSQLQQSPKFYLLPSANQESYAHRIERMLRETAEQTNLIVQGLGGQVIFRNYAEAVHVRVISSLATRLQRAKEQYGLGAAEAERFLKLSDRKHQRYIREVFQQDWTDPNLYHLIINTDGVSIEQSADLIMRLAQQGPSSLGDPQRNENDMQVPNFAHPSEKEFAELLDRYHLRWEYEPTTFPIEWDADGNVTMGFSPDFYLPEFDTYVELTTMKQQYASIKNQKIRRLKELYPNVNVRMVFQRDFEVLAKRFGLAKGSGQN